MQLNLIWTFFILTFTLCKQDKNNSPNERKNTAQFVLMCNLIARLDTEI